MSCLSALDSQIVTFLSMPHEILLLRHKVFREYAKTAVGPDFIHTLPSFLILIAITVVLWKNPPSSRWLLDFVNTAYLYRSFQIIASWITINAVLWIWLIIQRVIYCCTWTYWSHGSEYRDVSYPWWQRVWSSYYPPPLQPPVFSASLISWVISMLIAIATLGCALSTDRVRIFIKDCTNGLRTAFPLLKCYTLHSLKRSQEIPQNDKGDLPLDNEVHSICDECRSEISEVNGPTQREVHPISYGTNWTPKPNFSGKETQRKSSSKSYRTANEMQDADDFSPRQLRYRRGCHTMIPSNSSDKSSTC